MNNWSTSKQYGIEIKKTWTAILNYWNIDWEGAPYAILVCFTHCMIELSVSHMVPLENVFTSWQNYTVIHVRITHRIWSRVAISRVTSERLGGTCIWKILYYGLKKGKSFQDRAAHSYPKILWVTPSPRRGKAEESSSEFWQIEPNTLEGNNFQCIICTSV